MIADKIKILREKSELTQAALAKKLGVTRSGVNAWEMGITIPSTAYIVELAMFFGVSTDYLLDMPETKTISVNGLTDREIASLVGIVECYNLNRNSAVQVSKKVAFKDSGDMTGDANDNEDDFFLHRKIVYGRFFVCVFLSKALSHFY